MVSVPILTSLATTAPIALSTVATLSKDASLTRFPTAVEMAFVRKWMTLTTALMIAPKDRFLSRLAFAALAFTLEEA
jgi:hypothetical protein